ncbi:hypothetical protein AGMMS49975_27530 [Clostridia bacterium]|nr:hypothetical protein AGMMS49975_27530 [Clostridia bacterium]
MKKRHGHYCQICQQYMANEKFSGRDHAAYICKDCCPAAFSMQRNSKTSPKR